jgi:hypothetical protein
MNPDWRGAESTLNPPANIRERGCGEIHSLGKIQVTHLA